MLTFCFRVFCFSLYHLSSFDFLIYIHFVSRVIMNVFQYGSDYMMLFNFIVVSGEHTFIDVEINNIVYCMRNSIKARQHARLSHYRSSDGYPC